MSFSLNKYSFPFIFVRRTLIVLWHVFAHNSVDFLSIVANVAASLWSSLMDLEFQLAPGAECKNFSHNKHCQYELVK